MLVDRQMKKLKKIIDFEIVTILTCEGLDLKYLPYNNNAINGICMIKTCLDAVNIDVINDNGIINKNMTRNILFPGT